ncbi:MAG: L-glutamate gamma-semialdehyde dehydrogenase [Bdellovibrionaceae bacterium]|nr:L-glutamate gamma-semialdehyde dehydrogenase [Pseudobdellovibrionaceae bacterium]
MQDLQAQIRAKGEEILRRMESQSKMSLFSKDFWYGSIMEWSMKNEKFKTNMFRFVDVLPALNSGNEVAKHLKEYFEEGGEMPPVFKVGLGLGSLAPGLMANTIKKNVTEMAKMFITGENPQDALPVLKKARKNRLAFTVDILGEATLSEKEAAEYQNRYLELIDWLAKDAATWEDVPQLDRDHEGPIPKVNVSVKLTALYSQINDKAWDRTKEILKERLRPIYRAAMQKNVFLNLDMEHYAVKHLTVEVFKELMMEPEFRHYKFFGCVIQAYLRDSFTDIKDLTDFARSRGTPFTIRLVKGAYWDSETIEAEQRSWPIPVYTNKAESDANYEVCAKYLLENHRWIRAALASHNVRTLAAALVHAEKLALPKEAFEIQMLYGMAEPIKRALADMGYRVREYAPVGELIPGMAYLVRRLLENTSNESWLRGKFAEGQTSEKLLRDPAQGLTPTGEWPDRKGLFSNDPLTDFAVSEDRRQMLRALEGVQAQLPKNVQPVVDGREVKSAQLFERVNPSQVSQIVARVGMANSEMAEVAVQAAHKAFPAWKKTAVQERAALLDKVADLMVRDRFKLTATQVFEVGKPWAEADGDIGEAIDFCRYYARHARELLKPLKVGSVPGENSQYIYRPRGVTVVIAPWNFPLAILAGQVVSALVTGNTVVMKPAEQSSLVAQGLMDMLREAGFPAGVVHFLPGYGEEVGEYLVNHPLTTTIAFTGSKAVGLHILQRAALVQPGQQHVKRCIIEMGGKNAVIIDNDADLDEAVDGVLYSAFGFSGQKCSAASRCIVLDEVHDVFVGRLVEAARSIKVRAATDPESYLGPVVDKEAYDRIMATISQAETQHQLLFKGEVPETGFFVPPTIFGGVKGGDGIAQNEIFGPVLAILRAKDITHALELANGTEYALTGGLFSRSPANIARVREEFEVGNLYINRGITGAMVDRHPFGGFKMSGIGSKTGGPDYLRQFVEPIVVTENTMRRGFAPTE